MKKFLMVFLIINFFYNLPLTYAVQPKKTRAYPAVLKVPQPTTCITGSFSQTGNNWWSEVTLKLTNNCGQNIDFQNTSIAFNNTANVNSNVWGDFSPLTYPDNQLQITSQLINTNNYLSTLLLHFPEENWSNSILPNGKSISVKYGISYNVLQPKYIASSLKVYLNAAQPIQTGEINLTNISQKPHNVNQEYAVLNIVNSGQDITTVQLPWSSQKIISNLAPGNYVIQTQEIADNGGSKYQGTAAPATVTVNSNQSVASTIKYELLAQFGKINIQASPLPTQLSGYTDQLAVKLTRSDTGATTDKIVSWNSTTLIDQLANNVTYSFSTPVINYNSNTCSPNFLPSTILSKTEAPQTTLLTFNCVPIPIAKVTVDISGLPASINSIDVTFIPNDKSLPFTKAITINNGQGTDTINLNANVIYSISASSISGYSVTFNPQPLMAQNGVTETINYQPQASTGGRIIGFLPGWKQPPTAIDLANAGYTHIMVSFGVFSTTQPGQIVSAFDTVTKNYIDSLHTLGIKVLLSLGGALTSIPNTSVDFHQVLSMSSSPSVFQQTFIQSIKNMVSDYHFDGIDIDIEHGINSGGTFANPTGDIAVLANILNQLHADMPNLLITLTPQVANISATPGFDATWGNYASLVMQTYRSLSWVGVQNYNAGCAYGIDKVCYDPNVTNSPDFSAAMATDMLANWPATDSSGRATGFQPYTAYLTPNQVVIGYPSPNSQNQSDGSPITPTNTIKRAIQCLKTAVKSNTSCGNYLPPKAYGQIGGVFNWEVSYDQDNHFKFATDLKDCVINGNCQ